MSFFAYRDGILHGEDVPVPAIADRWGTPLWVYSRQALETYFAALAEAFSELQPRICFSVKSCHNLNILRVLKARGAAFDVVSGGELARVLEAGADPAQVVYAGVGKTDAEISAALSHGVGCFNVESPAELEVLADLAERLQRPALVALRFNPDVDAKTHPYTTTGKRENKFGVDAAQVRELFRRYASSGQVRVAGLHLHIGSPVNSPEPYVQAIAKALDLISELRQAGAVVDLLNIGGGFGTDYVPGQSPTPADYARAIVPLLRGQGLRIYLEPGRSISANAGLLLTRVVYVKDGRERRFVIVDAAMTDLIRPALYGAYHFVWPVAPGAQFTPPQLGGDFALPGLQRVDVVGGVCESSDFLARERPLPPVQRGDLLAVFTAGAYGSVLSSQYNSRPRAAEVLIEGSAVRLIRRRETYADLVAAEREI